MAENIEVGLELKDNMSGALGNVAKAISSFATKVDSGLTKVSEALADVDAAMRGMATTAQGTVPKSMASMGKATAETITKAEQLRRALKSINDAAGNPIDFGNIQYAGVDRLQGKLDELRQSIVAINTASTTLLSAQIAEVQGPQTRATGFESAVNFGQTQREAIVLTRQVEMLKQELELAFKAAANGSEGAAARVVLLTGKMKALEGEASQVSEEYAKGVQQIEQLTAKANSELSRLYGKNAPQVTVKDLFPTQAQSQLEQLENRIRSVAEQRIEIRALQDTFAQFGQVFPFLNKNLDATDAHVLRMVNNLPRLRYALYDISQNAAIAGAAMIGAFTATAATAIDLQRKFADVVRTTNLEPASESARKLKEEFFALRQELPIAFGELTKIGTLAGQLDIPANAVAQFTETVAKFAATTDVSVEDAATAFGRLDKLVFGVDEQFEKLGSSILAVGTSAVATEGQIIRVSQQISSIANLAGFSAAEIVGFSSALASVGISPELARGIVTRTFGSISTAAAAGGLQLERFGRVAGVSGAEFGAAWKEDAAGTFVKFLKGINEDGSVAEQTLRELGITSIRDIPSLLKLAQGWEEVSRQLGIATEGFENGTELQKQYDVIASTVAEKLKVLAGNFEILVATVGDTANGFGFAIDLGIEFLQILTSLARNPFGQAILNIVGAATLLGGSFSLLVAVGSKVIAGLSAGVTGAISLRTTFGLLRADLVATTAAQGANTAAVNMSAAAMNLASLQTAKAAGAQVGYTAVLRAQAAVIRENIAAMSMAQKVSLGAGIVGIALAATTAIAEVVTELNKTAGQKATEFFGDISTVLSAVKQDTEDWKNATGSARAEYETFTTTISSGNKETDAAAQSIREAAGANDQYGVAVDDATAKIEAQTIAIGKNTEEAIRALTVSKFTDPNGALVKLLSNTEATAALQKYGIEIGGIIAAGTTEGAAAGIAAAEEQLRKLADVTVAGKTANNISGVNIEEAKAGLQLIIDTYKSSIGLEEVIRGISEAEAAAGGTTEEFTDALAGLNEQFFEAEKLAIAQNSALFDLGQSLQENGMSFDILTAAGQANQEAMMSAMSAIAANSTSPLDAAANLQVLYNQMLAAGVPASQMVMLANAIAQLSGGKALPAATISMKPFNSGLKKSTKNAKSAADAVRTLVDYANDLKKVFSRAFEIRFASAEALEGVASSFDSMRESIQGAREEIDSLKTTIAELTADRALKEYFLEVALAYGDTLRAEQIRAELQSINDEIAQAQNDIADAQAAASTSLVGNSQAAIDNRSEIRGIVQSYSEYVSALAAAGASQDTLNAAVSQSRADFLAQAKALGFSEAELAPYLASFNDMATAVGGVNAGVTVAFNTDPALQALAELEAAASKTASGISDAFGDVDTEIPTDPAAESLKRLEERELRGFTNRVNANKGMGINWFTALGFDKVMQYPRNYVELPFGDAYKKVVDGAKIANSVTSTEFRLIGTAGTTQSDLVRNSWSNTANSIPGSIGAQRATAAANAASVGQGVASSLNSSVSGSSNIAGIISSKVSEARRPAEINSYSVGDAIGAFMKAGISVALNNILGVNSSARRIVRSLTGFAEGGYTGAGGKYDVAGIVHRGEYVVPKSEVNQVTQMPYFMEQPRTFAQGGYTGQSGPSMVSLSPEDRALLRNAGGSGNIVLYADSRELARSVNDGNRQIVAQGGRP